MAADLPSISVGGVLVDLVFILLFFECVYQGYVCLFLFCAYGRKILVDLDSYYDDQTASQEKGLEYDGRSLADVNSRS